jgi:hypothetical protein
MFKNKNPYALKDTMKMHERCAVCNQPFNIEVGFYYGSSFISYALSVAISIVTFVSWWLGIGISVSNHRVFYWLTLNAVFLVVLQPYLMRISRTGWLALFVRYDHNWKTNPPLLTERTNRQQENNW